MGAAVSHEDRYTRRREDSCFLYFFSRLKQILCIFIFASMLHRTWFAAKKRNERQTARRGIPLRQATVLP